MKTHLLDSDQPRVLIVDDDANSRKSLADVLSLNGFQTTLCESGKHAIKTASETDFEVAIVDLNLSGIDGIETIRQLKATSIDVECILLTGYATQAAAIAAINAGAFAFFEKPAHPEQLTHSMHKAIEQRNTRRKLAQSEALHRQIAQLTSDYVYQLRILPDGVAEREWMSDSFSQITGYDQSEIDPKTGWLSLVYPEDKEIANNAYLELLENKANTAEYRVVAKNGQVIWIQDFVRPVWDSKSKRVIQIIGAAKDITQQKIAAEKIAESEKRFRLLFEESPSPYQSLDIDGKIIDVNNAWLETLGYQFEEVSNQWFGNFILESQKEIYRQRFEKFKTIGVAHGVEYDLIHKNGSTITASFDGRVARDINGAFLRTHCILTNITERKKYEQAILDKSEDLAIINEMGQALAQTHDLKGIYNLAYHFTGEIVTRDSFAISLVDQSKQTLNAAFVMADGVEADIANIPPISINNNGTTGRIGAINLQKSVIVDHLRDTAKPSKNSLLIGDNRQPNCALYAPMVVEGKVIGLVEVQSYQPNAYDEESAQLLATAANIIGLSIANSRLFQDLNLQSAALNAAANGIVITDTDGKIQWANPAFLKLTGYEQSECLGKNPRELVKSNQNSESIYQELWQTILSGETWRGRLINRRKDGSIYTEEQTITPIKDEKGVIQKFIGIKEDVTERDLQEKELEVVSQISNSLRVATTREEMLPILIDQLMTQLHIDCASIDRINYEAGVRTVEYAGGSWIHLKGNKIPIDAGLGRMVMNTGKPFYSNEISLEERIYTPENFSYLISAACAPMIVQDKAIGLIWIGGRRTLGENDIQLLMSVANMAANAIHRMALYEQTEEKVKQLNSLFTIERTINTSLDLRVTLGVITKEAANLLGADIVSVLVYNPRTLTLEQKSGNIFRVRENEALTVRIGSGTAGVAALERKTKIISDTSELQPSSARDAMVKSEGYRTYICTPLIVKGEIKGVLEVMNRELFVTGTEWLNLLNSLAIETGTAIENSDMFFGLQRTNEDMVLAYDQTIEGWAKALNLHSLSAEEDIRLLADLSVKLARTQGMADAGLADIRRGAMLHDIGKIAIPDSILNKPGPLNDDEWERIKKHPQIVFDLLSPIKYLRPALDIPYCHHEKWDGTGYPRGLKGEEIPLSARIFAVVNVYEALLSDRPYRKAWQQQKAIDYLRSQAGIHFDPALVEPFLALVR